MFSIKFYSFKSAESSFLWSKYKFNMKEETLLKILSTIPQSREFMVHIFLSRPVLGVETYMAS